MFLYIYMVRISLWEQITLLWIIYFFGWEKCRFMLWLWSVMDSTVPQVLYYSFEELLLWLKFCKFGSSIIDDNFVLFAKFIQQNVEKQDGTYNWHSLCTSLAVGVYTRHFVKPFHLVLLSYVMTMQCSCKLRQSADLGWNFLATSFVCADLSLGGLLLPSVCRRSWKWSVAPKPSSRWYMSHLSCSLHAPYQTNRFFLNDLFEKENLMTWFLCFLTETWQRPDKFMHLKELPNRQQNICEVTEWWD